MQVFACQNSENPKFRSNTLKIEIKFDTQKKVKSYTRTDPGFFLNRGSLEITRTVDFHWQH